MNVGQLRKAIEGLDDSLEIAIDFEIRDGDIREIEEGDLLGGALQSTKTEERYGDGVEMLFILHCHEYLDDDGAGREE